MRAPPPVAYPLARSAPLAVALVVVGLLPLLQGLIWWLSQSSGGGQRALVTLVFASVLVWALWAWRVWVRWPRGSLHWEIGATGDGRHGLPGRWCWRDERTGQAVILEGVDVALDLQGHVLLRLRPTRGRSIWACASRVADPARWPDFRRAWTACAA